VGRLLGRVLPGSATLLLLFLYAWVAALVMGTPFFLWARRGRRVWPWILVLTICLGLLFLLIRNLNTAAHLVAVFTDFYDTESTAFLLLFAMLTCGGMLFGVVLAAIVAWVLHKINY
ncbi:hypothetical protein, partial [Oscillibacter sp.]